MSTNVPLITRHRPKSGNKEVQQLLDEYFDLGWSIEKGGNGHWKLTTPNGLATGSCSASPSCNYAMNNARRDLKKVLALSLERASKQQPPVTEEEKKRREQKDEKAMQTLKHSPFKTIHKIPVASNLPKPREVPAAVAIPPATDPVYTLVKPKKDLSYQRARRMIKEAVDTGLTTPEQAVETVLKEFRVITGFGVEVKAGTLIQKASDPFTGGHKKAKKKTYVKKEKPVSQKMDAPVAPAKAVSEEDIDKKLAHVRSILTLPFDKQKKMDLIIDLLQELL